MFVKGLQLSAKNLNNAYVSKTDTNSQSISSNLTINGGAVTLKNSVITDNASASYLRIDPQGNSVIIYDGVNNQRFDVYSSSGSESTFMQTINGQNGSLSVGMIDVTSAVDHFEIATNSGKRTDFGGKIQILNGNDLVLKAGSLPNDAGDIIFQTSGGTELARIYSSSGGVLSLSTGTNTDAQIQMTDSSVSLNEPTTVAGKVTVTSGGVDIQGSANALNFTFGGGGFNMIDSTWIRTTGSKSFYHNTGNMRTDGTLQVGNNGATLSVPNGGDVTAGASVLAKQFIVSGGVSTDIINNSPWYGIGRSNILYGTQSGGQLGVQVAGYYGLNLKTQNGELIFDPSYSTAPKYNGYNLWHSGNMGAGSNLDSDKVDGLQGSQLLRNDQNGTLAGVLTVSGSGATPLILQRNTNSNVNLQFVHTSANAYLGIDNTGQLKFGTVADLNASGYKVYHSNNDGSGSGLDADLIRAQEPFIDRGAYGTAQTTSANSITNRGIYRIYWSGMVNKPSSNVGSNAYEFGNLVVFDGGGGRTQFYIPDNDGSTGGLHFRQDYDSTGSWTAWHKVWDNYNMGAGSGMDSDKVDGLNASQFVRSDVASSFTTITGGSIVLNAGGTIVSNYNTGNVIKDFNNGNITISAVGNHLYLGYQNTTGIRLSSTLFGSDGTTTMADSSGKLYYQGNDIEGRYGKKAGDTWTGTHDLSGATLSWSRDTDSASISLVDYGANTDWLTVDFGDDTNSDRVRFRWNSTTAIFDILDTRLETNVPLNMTNHGINNIAGLYGQFGTIAESYDEWLRINADVSHTSGVYFGSSVVRTDLELQVGATGNSFKAKSSGDIELAGNQYFTTNNKTLYMKNTAGTNYGVLQIDSSDITYLASDSLSTVLRGSALTVRPVTTFNNNVTIGAGSIKSLLWDAGRSGNASIYWNASSTAQYGMTFKTDDATVLTLGNSSGDSVLATTLQITNAPDVTLSGGGALILGATTSSNIAMDTNEIQVRNNGVASSLNLNLNGGDVVLGSNLRMNLDTKVNVTNGVVTKTAIDFYGPTDSGNSGFGVAIGAGGQAIFGSGESAQTFKSGWQSGNTYGGANEVTYITSDNSIFLYPNQNAGYDVSKYMSYTNGQIELQGPTQTLQIGVTKYYNGSASGGDSIYNPAGQIILGGSSNVTAWAETGSFQVRTGTTGNSTVRFEVQPDGDVFANGRYVDTHYHTPAFKSITTSGWYTIATCGVNATNNAARAYGRFMVMDVASGRHEMVDFTAGTAYGKPEGMSLHILGRVKYGATETVGGLRIYYNSTDIYAKTYLQAYLTSGSNVRMYMEDYGNIWYDGWDPVDFTLMNSATNYTDYKFEMQADYTKPQNIASGATLPSQGMGLGDIFIQY